MHAIVKVAQPEHSVYAEAICQMIEAAAAIRGTGIAKRNPAYIRQKINQGKAVIALDRGKAVGFCYIENWEGTKYVANSGLIVHPDHRKTGLARRIKKATFDLSKTLFPDARLFGITTSLAVMKINSDLGYQPVTFSELTQDETFWKGCQGCVNFDILQRTERKMCLCTGMVCDLSQVGQQKNATDRLSAWKKFKRFIKDRKTRIKNSIVNLSQTKNQFTDGTSEK